MRLKLKNNSGKLFAVIVAIFALFIIYSLYYAPGADIEDKFIHLLKTYGYIILFVWSIAEGETGLIMAGILSHTGDMNLFLAIFIAGLGGFVGDQIYFYIGRFNKSYVHRKFKGQRRKVALAHILLKKYGWPIIFLQRYMYGMRTIIPISIGLTRYNAKTFALINLISAWCWAAVTIVSAWYFGEQILQIIVWAKNHWYLMLPFAVILGSGILYYLNKVTEKIVVDRS
jgi:membrane protein DedA with SNARE-associated domain